MPVIVNPPFVDSSPVNPNNVFVVAWDFWKDVVSGDPIGTSNGQRIAEQARDAVLAAGGTQQNATDTYNQVLEQAKPEVLYPPEKQTQLLLQVALGTIFVIGVSLYVYKKVL